MHNHRPARAAAFLLNVVW